MSSAAIAAGNPVKLISLEGCPETGKIAQEYLNKFGLENVHLKIGNFEEFAPKPSSPTPEGKAPQPPKGEAKISNNRQLTTDNQLLINHPPINHSQTFDLIYFDGNHQKEPTLKYFNQLLPLAHNDSVFIFDDIHWSNGMEEAWEAIKAHPQVRISIDSFYWGIVFFRKEQEKEHFILRL